MKKAFFTLMFIAGTSVYGQFAADSLQQPLQFKVSDILKPPAMDFSYYGKNYDKVFGEYIYTADANNYGQRNVYVGSNGRFYFQGTSTYITDAALPALHSMNFTGNMDIFGFVRGLRDVFNSEKDYSVKQP